MSALTLVPSDYSPATPGVRELVAEIEKAQATGRRSFEVEKFVGFDRDGRPDFPKVVLRAEIGPYGQPVASVKIYRTRTAYHDAATGSLGDLDVRVACEYYLKLDSAEALDAVEKVMHAPTPKAIALIALLGQLRPEQPEPVQKQKPQQEAIDV
jgi:hypothetical protein